MIFSKTERSLNGLNISNNMNSALVIRLNMKFNLTVPFKGLEPVHVFFLPDINNTKIIN